MFFVSTADCDVWHKVDGSALLGHNTHTLYETDVARCKEQCIYQDTFVCKSFDFSTNGRYCQLSVESMDTVPGDVITANTYVYYGRNLHCIGMYKSRLRSFNLHG